MSNLVCLESVAHALPPRVRESREVEALVRQASPGYWVRRGIVEAMSGIQRRRVADDGVQCSDLAAQAARKALAQAGRSVAEVDLLVFAAAGQDLIEPATAHIVQEKLGTSCQVFDVKNACNSFLNGLQVGRAMIESGAARTVLVVSGEICSRAVNWAARDGEAFRQNFPGFTMGDAGAAAVLGRSASRAGLRYAGFASHSAAWRLATVACGGSMNPHSVEHTYLQGDGPALKDAFLTVGPDIIRRMLGEAEVSWGDLARIFVHQVSLPYHREMLAATGMPEEKVFSTVVEYGNMASASIPVAHALAAEQGLVRPGDRVLWLGLASGISLGMLVIDV